MIPRNDIDELIERFCDNSADCESLSSLHDSIQDILNKGYNVCIVYNNST